MLNSSLDTHLPRYLVSPVSIAIGAAAGANIQGLSGLLMLGAAAPGGSIYKLYFVTGTNQYDTQFTEISTNSYGNGGSVFSIWKNPTNMDFSIVNNSSSAATVWAYFMGK